MSRPIDWSLLDHLTVGIMVHDTAGAELHRNPRVGPLVEGTSLADLDGLERRSSSLAQTCQATGAVETEAFEPAQGRGAGVRLTATPAPGVGSVITVEPLVASERVEERMREFISHLTHDLRTPLTSILGASDLLVSGRIGDVSESHQKLLRIVGEGTQKLTSMISDLTARFLKPEGRS